MSLDLPVESYTYRRLDNNQIVVVEMTVAELHRREATPGRILLEEGVPAFREHPPRVRELLDQLGS